MTKEFLKDDLRVFVVPVDIMDVPDLDIYEQMVYIVLRSFASAREATAFPSYATIAKLGRMSRRKAIDTVQRLIEKGLLKKEFQYSAGKNRKIRHKSNLYTIERPQVVHDMHHPSQPSAQDAPPSAQDAPPSAQRAPEQNHLTKSLNKKDDDDLKKGGKAPSSPSPFYQENKTMIQQFVDYAIMRGFHQDFSQEIADRLTKANYLLNHYTLGTAVNKTLEGIEAATVSHVPNYFMTVLENEVKKEQSSIAKRRSE